jgi:DNA-binding XRE family transcriptional regulator
MSKAKSYRNNLKRIRQEEGIHKASLAREAKLSERHISRIEAEIVSPTIETANRIKNALNKHKTSSNQDYTLKDIFPYRKEW